ncbi:hypothetical protein NDU88_007853 [Pleurodeles waltl]|uniref:Uncharacterized protein n=1 Tax=Pleurodeles waltl TaxID=8319 RepID=A0AAV7QT22_PLEWA|nr:hypothetical protein NDU88_007853 [Pleurodeles waltl]
MKGLRCNFHIDNCDRPIGDSPHTTPTGADTAPGSGTSWGRNQSDVPDGRDTESRKQNREPGTEEEPVSHRRDARNQEEEKIGAVGMETPQRRREEDKEEESRRPNSAVAREAERGTPAMLLEKRGTIKCISLPN